MNCYDEYRNCNQGPNCPVRLERMKNAGGWDQWAHSRPTNLGGATLKEFVDFLADIVRHFKQVRRVSCV